nr:MULTISPECIES: hypothetical protein [unclassified Butyricicoccus]
MDELLEKNAEEIVLKTITLLANCVEQLSKESVPAQSTYTTAKIATCLEILKLFAVNSLQNRVVDICDS